MSADEPIYVFLHVPFSAGTTIRNAITASHSAEAIFDCYGRGRTSASITDDIKALPEARRRSIKFVIGHHVWFGIDKLFDREVRYFTFLRNPISRAVSAYWRIRRDPRSLYHSAVNSMTLRQFADLPICRNHATVVLSRDVVDEAHTFTSCVDIDHTMLARAEANLKQCWFTGLHETFASDFSRLAAMLELATVPAANVRPPSQRQEADDQPATWHAIAQHNMMDLCLYSAVQLKREMAIRQFRT